MVEPQQRSRSPACWVVTNESIILPGGTQFRVVCLWATKLNIYFPSGQNQGNLVMAHLIAQGLVHHGEIWIARAWVLDK